MEVSRTDRTVLYQAAIEAMLLAAPEAMTAVDLAVALERVTGERVSEAEVEEAVVQLQGAYVQRGAGLSMERWGGGYRLATHPDMAAFVEASRVQEKAVRLSGALVETLAVVAYRQPVTKPEVDHVRGVDSGYALGRLAELRLIAVAGRSDGVGKPLLYATTPLFLESFGLADLSGLPTLREMEELLSDPAFSREKARLLLLQDEQAASEPPINDPNDETTPPDEA